MESLNEKFEKILNLLSIIQNACDSKRSLIEQYSHKCYSTHLAELKVNQMKQDLKKSLPVNHNEEAKKVASLSEGMEELAIADSLLEKARALRSKSKKFIKGEEQILSNSEDVNEKSNVLPAPIRTIEDRLLGDQRRHALLSYSKSSSSLEYHRSSKLHHSNSLDDQMFTKRIKVPKNRPFSKSTFSESSAFCKDKVSTNSDVGVVSHKQLKDLRNLPVCQTFSDKSCQRQTNKTIQSHCNISKSDSSQTTFKKSASSYRSFKDILKAKLQSNFQWRKDGFWYPFINSKSEKYLLEWTKCNSYGNFIKNIKLLYKIQEIMFWIDLLYLIGKEIFPIILSLDENDKNVVRFCNSLLSIYHERLQKTPLLNSE